MNQYKWNKNHRLSVARICTDASKQCLHAFSLFKDIFVASALILPLIMILCEVDQLKLHIQLPLKDTLEDVFDKFESLTQSNHNLLCFQLHLFDKGPDIGSHGEGNADLSEIGQNE